MEAKIYKIFIYIVPYIVWGLCIKGEDIMININNLETNFAEKKCLFTIKQIKETLKEVLLEQDKDWNDMQMSILIEAVEGSDWLKINGEEEHSICEIEEWIDRLEEEWKEEGRFQYGKERFNDLNLLQIKFASLASELKCRELKKLLVNDDVQSFVEIGYKLSQLLLYPNVNPEFYNSKVNYKITSLNDLNKELNVLIGILEEKAKSGFYITFEPDFAEYLTNKMREILENKTSDVNTQVKKKVCGFQVGDEVMDVDFKESVILDINYEEQLIVTNQDIIRFDIAQNELKLLNRLN